MGVALSIPKCNHSNDIEHRRQREEEEVVDEEAVIIQTCKAK